jgi:polyisoprenoid-binding protein YceI
MRLAWRGLIVGCCLLASPPGAFAQTPSGKAEPMKAGPAKIESAKSEPAKAEPAKADSPPGRPVLMFDPARAQAAFEVYLRVPMTSAGRFSRVTGQIQGDAATGWTVLVQVDGTSLQFEGPAWMDRATRSDPFLAIDRYPDIRFASAPFTDGQLHDGGLLRGDLQLRGRRRPVSFELLRSECARPGYDCDIVVRGRISRHDFGMNTQRMMVRDEVDFRFSVRFLVPAPHPVPESRP